MLTKEELKALLKPIMLETGADANKFADAALPIAQRHFGTSMDFDEMADIWNLAVVEVLQENFVTIPSGSIH